MRGPTPLHNFFYGFKWLTALMAMIIGALAFVFGMLNMDLPVAQWFLLFGFFYCWCGYNLKETLKREDIRDQDREDDDESPYDTLRPV